MASKQKITSIRKAAAILIAIGKDSASEVYKYLHEDEIEELSVSIAKTEQLSADELQDVLGEFYQLCITQKVIAEGGQNYAREVLLKAFGEQRTAVLMERIEKLGKNQAFEFLRKVDYKNLLMIIQNEHPQTIALILSYTKPEMASKVIAELPKETQVAVFQRIASLDRTSPEIIGVVEKVLLKKLGTVASVDLVEFGGVNYLAEIMNNVDRRTERNIFDELKATNPELADEIKKRMFVFEDIVFLENMEIQAVIRECDVKDLTIALKAASEEIANVLYTNMSQRQQDAIKTDLQYLHNVRMRDVEEAQQRIVGVIRRLEEQGDLVISKGGKDEIIA
ncbi:MAG: flagellar motor switch protein FliG [Oscillospiraceae bacterium]